jgi:Cu(I)/Ag(I) efflux system periplasmic protein CusF
LKNLKALLIVSALLAGTSYSFAASHAGAPSPMGDVKSELPMAASADMADGEIRKVDMDNKKITIKHGEIKNLDMPGMTMVFQVKDPAMLITVKTGDKVRFKAEKSGGAIVVTEIQPAK